MLHFSLTISKLALFEHLTEALAELEVALVLGTVDELFELIGTGLLRLGGRLLVHGLWLLLVHGLSLVRLGLVRLLKDTRWMMGFFAHLLHTWYFRSKSRCRFLYVNINHLIRFVTQ